MPRKKSYESGARAGTQAIRRENAAAAQIEAHVSTFGEHSKCDPKRPESLCAECAELWSESGR
jgi:Mg-chelatase subunit ChlI